MSIWSVIFNQERLLYCTISPFTALGNSKLTVYFNLILPCFEEKDWRVLVASRTPDSWCQNGRDSWSQETEVGEKIEATNVNILVFCKTKWLTFAKARPKGQIKPEADWRAVESPIKWMNEFVLFAFLLSQQTKQILCSFFGRLNGAPKLLSVLSDL